MTLRVGSLFSGIGGLDLGLQRAGMEIMFQVENDHFCQQVLKKNFPKAKRFHDVQYLSVSGLPAVDLICGGFPCQGVSNAGNKEGLNDSRSALWTEFARIVREMGCPFFLVENVGTLSVRGLRSVMADIHNLGYNAEWSTIPASALGFPHKRERLFIFAYASGIRLERRVFEPEALQESAEALDQCYDRPAVSEPLGIPSTNGFPCYVGTIRGCGNAVVPQVAQLLGYLILRALK